MEHAVGVGACPLSALAARETRTRAFNLPFLMPFSRTPCSKKSGKSTKKTGGASRRRRRIETFGSYIYKVLKQVHPG